MIAEAYKKGVKITLEQVLHAREDMGSFELFCETFLSNVVGRNTYNSKVGKNRISNFATVSDEAFAIVCLENSIDRWNDEAEDPNKTNKVNWRPSRYTANPSESRKYGGWNLQGIRRFNILSNREIPEQREESKQIEKSFLKQKQSKNNVVKVTRKKDNEATYNAADLPFMEPVKPWKEKDDDNDDEDSVERTDDEYTSDNEDDQEPQESNDYSAIIQRQDV